MRVSGSILIARPLEEVWAFASDHANDLKWRTGVTRMEQDPPGPSVQGARLYEEMRLYGLTFKTHSEVFEVEPLRRYAYRSTRAAFPIRGGRQFEAAGAGTRLTEELEVDVPLLMRPFEPLARRLFQRMLDEDLARLKGLLEAAPGARAA